MGSGSQPVLPGAGPHRVCLQAGAGCLRYSADSPERDPAVTLLVALLLPALFWDKGTETTVQLKQAGITEVAVPAPLESDWKSVGGFHVRTADPQNAVKL